MFMHKFMEQMEAHYAIAKLIILNNNTQIPTLTIYVFFCFKTAHVSLL